MKILFLFLISGIVYSSDIHEWVGISVKESPYNAYGDGIHDDSVAILAAVNAAAATASANNSRSRVIFPPGIYLIGTTAVLMPTNTTSMPGIDYQGFGWDTSILRLNTASSNLYFSDNGSVARTQFSTFEDLQFQGMNPSNFSTYSSIPIYAMGFRMYSTGQDQGFKFTRCWFNYLNQVFDFEGTVNADSCKFYNCKISHILTNVEYINNVQSLDQEFYGTDMEALYGDGFDFGANGGGAIKIYGGSIIPFSDATTQTYFINLGGVQGIGTQPNLVDGARFETRGNYTNILNMPGTVFGDIEFKNCNFLDENTNTKTAYVSASNYNNAHFEHCQFSELYGEAVNAQVLSTSNLWYENGSIYFDNCALPQDFSDQCTITGSWGQIKARGCYAINSTNGVVASGYHEAFDFDSHMRQSTPGPVTAFNGSGAPYASGSPLSCNMELKTAQIKLDAESWPNGTTPELTILLPKNAIIKTISILKPGFTSENTPVTYFVGTSNKGTTFFALPTTPNVGASTIFSNYFYNCSNLLNSRTIRLWSSGGVTSNLYGGMALVEYY